MDGNGIGRTTSLAALLMAGSALVGTAQSSKSLSALTMPAESLPSGCTLVRPPFVPRDGVTIIGVPTPEFPTNPWSGTDRKLVAAIREAVDGTPPVSTVALESKLTEDILEAYRAVYMSAQGTPVVLLAITYGDMKMAEAKAEADAGWGVKSPLVVKDWQTLTGRLVRGATLISMSTATDAPNPCFDAISAFVWTFK